MLGHLLRFGNTDGLSLCYTYLGNFVIGEGLGKTVTEPKHGGRKNESDQAGTRSGCSLQNLQFISTLRGIQHQQCRCQNAKSAENGKYKLVVPHIEVILTKIKNEINTVERTENGEENVHADAECIHCVAALHKEDNTADNLGKEETGSAAARNHQVFTQLFTDAVTSDNDIRNTGSSQSGITQSSELRISTAPLASKGADHGRTSKNQQKNSAKRHKFTCLFCLFVRIHLPLYPPFV